MVSETVHYTPVPQDDNGVPKVVDYLCFFSFLGEGGHCSLFARISTNEWIMKIFDLVADSQGYI